MLIVETADMLQAPLFTAEALLRAHGTIKLTHTQLLVLKMVSTGSVLVASFLKQISYFAHPRFDSGKGPVVVCPFLCLTMVALSQNEQDHFNNNNNKNSHAKINKKANSRLYTRVIFLYRDSPAKSWNNFYLVSLVSTKCLLLLSKPYPTVYL